MTNKRVKHMTKIKYPYYKKLFYKPIRKKASKLLTKLKKLKGNVRVK